MGAFANGIKLWTDKKIPYVLDKKHPFYRKIVEAINEVNKKTVIQIIQRTNENNYVEFVCYKDKCNYSHVGMIGGRQEINIKHNVRVLHELGHCIGLVHEHQRPDRDDHIEVFPNKVSDSERSFFESSFYEKESDISYCSPYDINSCMHYWSTCAGKEKSFVQRVKSAFSGKGFQRREATWVPCEHRRHRNYETSEKLSDLDVSCINSYYN